MTPRSFRFIAAAALAAAALSPALLPGARSQVQATPSFVPIGVSSSGTSSTAWFHEPSSRQTVACQTVAQGSALSGIHCVATRLP